MSGQNGHLQPDDDLDDEDEPWIESIGAKWAMDGASTLAEAARLLRAHADWLEALQREGWELIAPIDDDHGFIANSDPTKRLTVPIDL